MSIGSLKNSNGPSKFYISSSTQIGSSFRLIFSIRFVSQIVGFYLQKAIQNIYILFFIFFYNQIMY
jgi:hypothetical protein